MKPVWVIYMFMHFYLAGKSQDTDLPFSKNLISIPESETSSTTSIARFIVSNYKSDYQKLRAIYFWVGSNITYSSDSVLAINWSKGKEAIISEALRRRKGVCENFAAIFSDIANKAGVQSYVIHGYTKQAGRIDKSGHSWCTVKYNNKWLLCDPTWDKDKLSNPDYFLVEPEAFILSHIPFDPIWQMLDYPVTQVEFITQKTRHAKDQYYINFTDSIIAYSNMTELQQMQREVSRMEEETPVNDLYKNRISYLKMLINFEKEDKDMILYNEAVASLNTAVTALNEFINFRNNKFLPQKNEAEITGMLYNAILSINLSFQLINEISKLPPSYQYDQGTLMVQVNGLTKKLNEQREFLKNYFSGK